MENLPLLSRNAAPTPILWFSIDQTSESLSQPSDDVVQTGTDVIFLVSHTMETDVQFTIKYGDGSFETFNVIHDVLAHKNLVPGKYWAQVSVQPGRAPEVN